MSLRFKELRKSKITTKTEFAKKMEVTFRTVTNWEKRNGVIPSLETVSRIAKTLNVSTFSVYETFVISPDTLSKENDFPFNQHDLSDNFRSYSMIPGMLFKAMKELKLYGSGIIQYEGNVFLFNEVIYNERKDTPEDYLELFTQPYSSIIFNDNNFNFVPITTHDISRWRLVSKEYNNLTFEVDFTSPILSDMKSTLAQNQVCKTYITFFNYQTSIRQRKKNDFCRMDQANVLSRYIHDIRTQHNYTQKEFAEAINPYLPEGKTIDNQTINKWENQKREYPKDCVNLQTDVR